MLFVSGKINDDLLEVTDSYEKTTRLISIKDALTLGTRVYGLYSNGTVIMYSSVQKFLNMFHMRQALCNSLASYEIDYDTQSGLITMRSCLLSDSITHDLAIPDFVDVIDDYVFKMCLILRSVVIPESVRRIGCDCFDGCKNLESVVMEGTSGFELDIGECAFRGCEALEHVGISNAITHLGSGCFNFCSSLDKIQLPDSVKTIGEFCFGGCSSLQSVVLPSFIDSLPTKCFYGCVSLGSIVIPDSVKVIGVECFKGCVSLSSVRLSDNLREIGSNAFKGCIVRIRSFA